MSLSLHRLLTGTVSVGLFADHCWLHGRRINLSYPLAIEANATPDQYLEALVSLFEKAKQQLPRGTRLVLTVSDSLAAFAMLPWQDDLQRPAEWESYARILFEKQGRTLDSKWLLHTEFMRYRSNGIAYALRVEWVARLEEIVRATGLQLLSVLPASAAAFCRLPKVLKLESSLLLLIERYRLTALSIDIRGLQNYDVEPVIVSALSSSKRLLSRVSSTQTSLKRIQIWSSIPEGEQVDVESIKMMLPKVDVKRLSYGAWI